MAIITFATRYLFLEGKLPIRLGPNIKQILTFSTPAVLTAIFTPIVFIHDYQLHFSFSNTYLWGAIAAIFAAYKTGNVYWTIGLGTAVFIIVRNFF